MRNDYGEWLVAVRYSEVRTLVERLRAQNLVIPSIPGKRYLTSSTGEKVLEDRSDSFNVLIKALLTKYVHHPKVRDFLHLREVFLSYPLDTKSCLFCA